jgi:cellulose synthase/poly-beta-1,6-N-acetylglucosamine synthase-like glycosyltransferase
VIIQILSRVVRRGYLPKGRASAVGPFFAGMNLAVRRDAFRDIGPFDEDLRTGEDMDFCIRAADSAWEVYFDPDATVSHHNRSTLTGLVKQWFDYGYYHAALFAKHGRHAIEVFAFNRHPLSHVLYTPLFTRTRAPFRAVLFLTTFAAFHALLLAGLLALACGLLRTATVLLLGALVGALLHFREDLEGPGRGVMTPVLRYVVNASLVTGGLLGGLRRRYLFVYGTLWRRAGAP